MNLSKKTISAVMSLMGTKGGKNGTGDAKRRAVDYAKLAKLSHAKRKANAESAK